MIEFEKLFTRQDYVELVKAVKEKKEYKCKKTTNARDYEIEVATHFSENDGIWKDNFFFSVNGMHRGKDAGGFGYPFSTDEITKMTYEDIILKIYKGFGLEQPKTFQTDFLLTATKNVNDNFIKEDNQTRERLTTNENIYKYINNFTYLRKFYRFLNRNSNLNFAQAMQLFNKNSEITLCKTFDEWNKIGRRVRKGEKALYYTNANNTNYKYYVFDASQTYGEKILEAFWSPGDLVTVLNKLCYLPKQTTDNEYDDTIRIIKQYNLEAGFDRNINTENTYLEICIALYVSSCFHKDFEILDDISKFDGINDDTKLALCIEAEEISKTIIKYIEEGKNFSNEYKEFLKEKRNNKSIETKDTRTESTDKSNGVPEQVRKIGTAISKSTQQEQVSLFNDDRNINGLLEEYPKSSNENGNRFDGTTNEEDKSTSTLFRKDESNSTLQIDGGRNSDEGNSLRELKNYVLTNDTFIRVGGLKTRYTDNINAINLVKQLDEEDRQPTDDEKLILSKYSGWGAIPQVFDNLNLDWEREYAELKETLSQEEYEVAKGSVLNAHYTPKSIIDSIYKALKHMGLDNGKILEPAVGIGNFIGLLPESFNKKSVYGVELDNLTGKIAKYLYPESNIQIKGFEDTNFSDNEFDAVITNVPFGNYKVYDRAYDKYNFLIHDYFIAKSIDKIRPNGICAVITSKGTLDKKSTEFRKYLADRAELIGAVRLPNNSFKENAGTEVTTDVLFLKKRPSIIDSQDSWIYVSNNNDNIQLNNYYIENPQMMLGNMKTRTSMYGVEAYLEASHEPIEISFDKAINLLPENIYVPKQKQLQNKLTDESIIEADYSVKNFCYTIINNRVYMRIDNEMILQKIPQTQFLRMSKLIEIRDEVRTLLNKQINNCFDEELKKEQQKLNYLYDHFVNKFGYLNNKVNRSLFREDADYALVVALENYNEREKTATKTDIFSQRTIRTHERVKTANNAVDALQICKNELGKVDIKYIEQLTGQTYDEVLSALTAHIYKNPSYDIDDKYAGWETADDYLSGNVKRKLKVAEIVAKDYPSYEKNVNALKLAQPEPIPASDISARLGATWIDLEYYKQFLMEKFEIGRYLSEDLIVDYNRFNGSFIVRAPTAVRQGFKAINVYGTTRMNAIDIFEHSLNLQTVTVYDHIKDGESERTVVNQKETILAREKQRIIEEEFKNWIFDNAERRGILVDKYNDLFNNTKLKTFNGDYLTFPEMNPLITLKKHQIDAVDRIITSGNTLLHHVVGAGKTFEMIAAIMKLRQYGLAHKPMIVVPNHLVMQWTREFKLLYPNSNVLMATKRDLEKQNRLKFVAKVATGDWDAVIIASSSFEKIPLSQERKEAKINNELQAIERELADLNENGNLYGKKDKITVKMLEQAKRNKKAQLKKLLETKSKDDLLKFEDLGVDYLFVDEAHKYKNKFIFTKMNNVSGISQAMSQRATDMEMKCDYINELHNGNKGVVFATGTPISNSMVEMYTMQSYMQKQQLELAGINYFDAWAALFGEKQNALELAPSGKGYRTKTRFAKFINLPELMTMYRSFADVKTAEQLSLPVPKANKITVLAKPSEDILKLNEEIQERAEKIHEKLVSPEIDNMLKITSDGKKIALDPRIYDRNSADDYENKLNVCVRKVFEIWKDTMENKSTQIIFCDTSTPKKFDEEYDSLVDFDVYNDIKIKLVQLGIPSNEIKFIHEAKTDLQKQTLFDEVTNGIVRIIIGSTEKCGAGTNIQRRLIALHHLDTPYRPSDLEQREGRIIRQGNMNEEVNIYTYVTERTFDSYSYQILENKQKFISQINNGDVTIREASDIDDTTLSYAEIKAITTANPKIKEKMEVEQELQKLRTLESQYKNNKYLLEDKVNKEIPQNLTFIKTKVENLMEDIKLRDANKSNSFSLKIGNKVYSERVEAGKELLKMIYSEQFNGKSVGEMNGFQLIPQPITSLTAIRTLKIKQVGTYEVDVSTSDVGMILKIENCINNLNESLPKLEARYEDLEKQSNYIKEELKKPFEYADKISSLSKRLSELDAELDLNNEEIVVLEESEDNENIESDIVVEDEIEDEESEI